MSNKLLIIQPSHYHSKNSRTVFKSHRRSLALPYLAALTPPEWDVTLVDEQIQDIDFDCQPDLVAITSWTVHSIRGYDVAREFRHRGIPVIMGGPHVWFHPQEASEHCEAIGIGEAEPIWSQMLQDAAAGRLQKVYRAPQMPSIAGLPVPRWDLLDLKKYGPFKTFTLMSSRGCPMQCEFCSERLYLGGGFRTRPVEDVIEEIKRCGSKNIFFGDSVAELLKDARTLLDQIHRMRSFIVCSQFTLRPAVSRFRIRLFNHHCPQAPLLPMFPRDNRPRSQRHLSQIPALQGHPVTAPLTVRHVAELIGRRI